MSKRALPDEKLRSLIDREYGGRIAFATTSGTKTHVSEGKHDTPLCGRPGTWEHYPIALLGQRVEWCQRCASKLSEECSQDD
jgi:hypothetical protein